jgi:lipopolysaccharide/colanic/teichoic acid biosynthesis glycosyltransferase
LRKNYIFIKRVLDLSFSYFITFLFLPVLLLLVILIKLTFSGTVIFRQQRIGKGGKEFLLFKFRTMDSFFSAYAPKPKEDDPRIKKFGRFLRNCGLDELPQLYNVLKGDMSIVGPRPEMPFLVSTFKEKMRERETVKPGITGLWQISGKTQKPIFHNLEYDLYYIKNQSLSLDFKILIKTLVLFFKMLKQSLNCLFIKRSI